LNDHAKPQVPELSVVIVTPDDYRTIRTTVRFLLAQTVRERLEIVLVAPSRQELALEEAELEPFCCHRVVEIGWVESLAAGNAAGVRQATAPVIALLEDHSRPHREWAQAVLEAHKGPWAAVGPVMGNPNPGSAVSWADFLLGFGTWWMPTEGGPIDHLPTHNASYRRDVLMQYDAELEDMLKAEIVLHWDLCARGHQLYLESNARVHHVNFELLSSLLQVQFHAGRVFAAIRAHGWSPLKRMVYAAGSPLIPGVRLRYVLRQIARRGQLAALPASVYPLLVLGLATSALGEMAGYSLGLGGASRSLGRFEFHRERHLRRRA
jgi:hypothetical protein